MKTSHGRPPPRPPKRARSPRRDQVASPAGEIPVQAGQRIDTREPKRPGADHRNIVASQRACGDKTPFASRPGGSCLLVPTGVNGFRSFRLRPSCSRGCHFRGGAAPPEKPDRLPSPLSRSEYPEWPVTARRRHSTKGRTRKARRLGAAELSIALLAAPPGRRRPRSVRGGDWRSSLSPASRRSRAVVCRPGSGRRVSSGAALGGNTACRH